MSKILVTGGAGFIGSHFVRQILSEDVIVLDKLTYASNIKRLDGMMDKITFVKGDICDKETLLSLFEKYDIQTVVNFAAESHVDNSIDDASDFLKTNVFGVQNLMDVCRRYFTENSLFIQVSTDEVYGPSETACKGDAPLRPKNPYAASKASAELLIKAYENTYDFPSIITRASNNYGPSQHEEKLMAKVMKAIKNHEDIPVYGDGQQKRCWLHVEDHVRRLESIIKNSSLHEIHNISGWDTLSNLELIHMIISLFEEKGHVYKGKITHVKDRPGHDAVYTVFDENTYLNKKTLRHGLMELIEHTLIEAR